MSAKVIPIRPPSPEDQRRKAVIDEYGEVTRRLELCEPDQERAKLLKAEIESWDTDRGATEVITHDGHAWQVQFSARRNERTVINKPKAFALLKKALGLDGVIAMLDMPLGVLDKHIPESQRTGLVHQERAGYRTCKLVALNPVSKAA